MVTFNDVLGAAARISSYVNRTPVHSSSTMNSRYGASLYFKCENFQKVGAFKARGACSAVMALSPEQLQHGVATHSSGNHAAALAYAAGLRGIPCTVVMPSNAPNLKRNAVASYGATIVECGPTLTDRLDALSGVVERTGAYVIPPFDDDMVIAGQATAALELIEEVGPLDMMITPLGGGGLTSGTSIVVRALMPRGEMIGIEPAMAGDARISLSTGRIEPHFPPHSIADGLRTSISERTLEIMQRNQVRIEYVSEEAIVEATLTAFERLKIVIEPSSAVTLAFINDNPELVRGKRVGVVLTGGNVDVMSFMNTIAQQR